VIFELAVVFCFAIFEFVVAFLSLCKVQGTFVESDISHILSFIIFDILNLNILPTVCDTAEFSNEIDGDSCNIKNGGKMIGRKGIKIRIILFSFSTFFFVLVSLVFAFFISLIFLFQIFLFFLI
jgi:hypothetical protein